MSGEWIKGWFCDCVDEVCATLDGGAVVVIAKVNPMAELTPEATGEAAALIASAPALVEALKELVVVIDAAGLRNLTTGVQLGPTVWYVKANDAMDAAHAALKAAGVSL